jgi:hypothetical protein
LLLFLWCLKKPKNAGTHFRAVAILFNSCLCFGLLLHTWNWS